MKAIIYQLRLLEPMLVAQAQSGEENSAVGLSFVPGSALRGALASRYLAGQSLADPAGDATFRRYFLDGTVCFLNAYPMQENTRLLPRPLSWFAEKDMADSPESTVYDWAVDRAQHLDQAKGPEGEFCSLLDSAVALHTPARQVNVHITLNNPNRRGDENQVFRYEALASGQVLAGAIVSADDADLTIIETLMQPAEIFLGGAHLAGYGRARIEAVTPQDGWQEVEAGHGPDSGEVIVTLLSDVIVRGLDGQVNGDLSTALAQTAGLENTPTSTLAFQRLHLVAGFNRKWSLPLVQDWAIQAGSVFVFPPDSFDPDALARAVARGVGERRAEGFGRVAINWQSHAELQRRKFDAESLDTPDLSDGSKRLARQMASRRLRNMLERGLADTVNNTRLRQHPKNAQLSRLRVVVQRARLDDSMEGVLAHLSNLKAAKQQFERARMGERTSLLDWLEERARTLDVQTQLLRGAALPTVAGEPAELSPSVKLEFTARLIDGVIKKAMKENQPTKEDE